MHKLAVDSVQLSETMRTKLIRRQVRDWVTEASSASAHDFEALAMKRKIAENGPSTAFEPVLSSFDKVRSIGTIFNPAQGATDETFPLASSIQLTYESWSPSNYSTGEDEDDERPFTHQFTLEEMRFTWNDATSTVVKGIINTINEAQSLRFDLSPSALQPEGAKPTEHDGE